MALQIINIKMLVVQVFLTWLVIPVCYSSVRESYVEKVECNSARMQVVLKTDSSLFNDTGGYFSVYSLSSACGLIATFGLSPPTGGVTLHFSSCNVILNPLLGPSGEVVAKMTNQFFLAVPTSPGIGNFSFAAYCFYPTTYSINASMGTSVSGGVDNGTHGQTIVPSDHVQLNLTDASGNVVTSVIAGQMVAIKIAIPTTDDTYNSTLPLMCYFSDGADMTTRIPIIENGCPNTALIAGFPSIKRLRRINPQTYEIDFAAFLLGNSLNGTLNIYCEIRLCLDGTRCSNDCWATRRRRRDLQPSKRLHQDQTIFQDQGILTTSKNYKLYVRYESPGITTTKISPTKPATQQSITTSPTEKKWCFNKTFVYSILAFIGLFFLLFIMLLITVVYMACNGRPTTVQASEKLLENIEKESVASSRRALGASTNHGHW